MASKSGIEWTDSTWNPIAGCTRVSPGCQNCYAEAMARRLASMGQEKYQGTVDKNGRWTGVLNMADEKAFSGPLRNKKPTMYFVNSMSDLLHEKISLQVLTDIFEIMAKAHWHTFQVLTKRSDRLWILDRQVATGVAYRLGKQKEPGFWPLSNVWLGVSVENQKYADERIPQLLRTPAAVRFLSCEPLLGPISLRRWFPPSPDWPDCGLHWVIAGGESGPNARPMNPDWARQIRDQCQTSSVPFFFKQHGGNRKVGGAWGGNVLDGRTHLEFPKVERAVERYEQAGLF